MAAESWLSGGGVALATVLITKGVDWMSMRGKANTEAEASIRNTEKQEDNSAQQALVDDLIVHVGLLRSEINAITLARIEDQQRCEESLVEMRRQLEDANQRIFELERRLD